MLYKNTSRYTLRQHTRREDDDRVVQLPGGRQRLGNVANLVVQGSHHRGPHLLVALEMRIHVEVHPEQRGSGPGVGVRGGVGRQQRVWVGLGAVTADTGWGGWGRRAGGGDGGAVQQVNIGQGR